MPEFRCPHCGDEGIIFLSHCEYFIDKCERAEDGFYLLKCVKCFEEHGGKTVGDSDKPNN